LIAIRLDPEVLDAVRREAKRRGLAPCVRSMVIGVDPAGSRGSACVW
jgi:hypothetical protein